MIRILIIAILLFSFKPLSASDDDKETFIKKSGEVLDIIVDKMEDSIVKNKSIILKLEPLTI